jgi:hypothetical protein
MFVFTETIDCIFLLFSKILSLVLSISPLYCTDVAQDGVFLEIALRTLWTPGLACLKHYVLIYSLKQCFKHVV